MELEDYEYQLIELLDRTDLTEEQDIELELSIVRRAIGQSMSPQSQNQFIEASKRDIQHILDNHILE